MLDLLAQKIAEIKSAKTGAALSDAESASQGEAFIALFAGTSEGREIALALKGGSVKHKIFVASDYAREILLSLGELDLEVGRKDAEEMLEALKGARFVIDATHPFALEVSENIKKAASVLGVPLLRIKRPKSSLVRSTSLNAKHIFVDNYAEAAHYAQKHEGRVFLATGSKTLSTFAQYEELKNRLIVRVLPDPEILKSVQELGIKSKNIVAMQGPFSYELNRSLFESQKVSLLITKDSGPSGGFLEKIEAADSLGIDALIIGRPEETHGAVQLEDVLKVLNGGSRNIAQDENISAEASDLSDYETYLKFPLFFDLKDKKCLVVGGGLVGSRRAEALFKFGAQVTVVDHKISACRYGIIHLKREFELADLEGIFLVSVCTNNSTLNDEIAHQCKERGILVNVSSNPQISDFYFPAIIESKRLIAGMISKNSEHSFLRQSAQNIRDLMAQEDLKAVSKSQSQKALVSLVGAGPGDIELLTLKAQKALAAAEVIVYDRLVNPELLKLSDKAELIYVGKEQGRHPAPQEKINEILLEQARRNKNVVRLKGGDPYLFGRGSEERDFLEEHGVEVRIIPGISSALSVPALSRIPVTARNVSSSVHIVTGHAKSDLELEANFKALVNTKGTLVFMMAVGSVEHISHELIKAGMNEDMPAAFIENGSLDNQRCIKGTIKNIAELSKIHQVKSPAIFIVGEVVDLA